MDEKKELISIIVPIYNAELYLKKCIESILKQSYRNFELILVDDGSKDSSATICKEFAKGDSRIHVICKENGGASSARNVGLDNAKGEYIVFQDSDDYMLEHALQTLYENIKKEDADMCVGSISINKDSGSIYEYQLPIEKNMVIVSEREYWKYCFVNYVAVVPWAKIYKRSLWEGIYYVEGKIHEDEQVLQFILPRCKKIVMLKNIILIQNCLSTSVMNQTYSEKNLSKSEFMVKRFYYFYDKGYSEYYFMTFGEGSRILLEAKNKLAYKQDMNVNKAINELYKQHKVIVDVLLGEDISIANKCRLYLFKMNLSMYGVVRKLLR